MARRGRAKGTWRPRKKPPPASSSLATGEDGAAAEESLPPAPAKRSGGGGFFCCYLLRSLCPRLKGRTYIGFTVNPRRRIRQHNGEISSGAWRTRRGRPWEMVLCIHGFPTNVAALQFEWAWQHPKESLAVREAASGFKTLSGAGNKVKLAYAMLNLPSWENLNLTVNFFSSTSAKFAAGCPPLPSQMKTAVCPLEDLQCHAKSVREEHGPSSQEDNINEEAQGDQVQPMDAQTRTDLEEDNYSSDDFDLMEQDGILDLTDPKGSRTSSQCHQGQDSVHGDEHSEYPWKEPSSDQVQPMDAQTRTAVYDIEEDNYSSDDFVLTQQDGILDLTETDGIHDLTEPEGSRTPPQPSMNSDTDGDRVVEDELEQVSPVWKVSAGSAESGDSRVVDDEHGETSPVWKAFARSDSEVVNNELGQASPTSVLKVGADSESGDSAVSNDELGHSSPMLMVDAGSDKGERHVMVDLVTPTPAGRLRRRAGMGSICPRIIDLTASPVVIEL